MPSPPDHDYRLPPSTPASQPHPIPFPSQAGLRPGMIDILQTNLKLFRNISKPFCTPFSRIFCAALDAVIASPDATARSILLLALSRCVLALPPRRGRHHASKTKQIVQDRIRRWESGLYADLWAEATARRQGAPQKQPNKQADEVRRCQVISAAQDGQYSKAAKALARLGLAPPSPAVLNHLRPLHPHAAPPKIPIGPAA
jgi:hypothetical protein